MKGQFWQLNDPWLEAIYILRWIIDKDREHLLTDTSDYLKSTLMALQYSEHTQACTKANNSVCYWVDLKFPMCYNHICKMLPCKWFSFECVLPSLNVPQESCCCCTLICHLWLINDTLVYIPCARPITTEQRGWLERIIWFHTLFLYTVLHTRIHVRNRRL